MDIGVYSYSKMQAYKQCQLKAKLKYIDKMPDSYGDAAKRGSRIHDSLENWSKGTGVIDHEINTVWEERLAQLKDNQYVHPEKKFGFKIDGTPCLFFDKQVFFRGVYDALLVLTPQWEKLYEYKTGKPRPEHIKQLSCYARARFVENPELERIDGTIIYLDFPKFKHTEHHYDRGCEKHVVNRLMKPVWQLDDIVRSDDVATACQSPLCGWCAYSKKNDGPCKF